MSAKYSSFASGSIRENGPDNAGTPPRTIAVVTFSATTNPTAMMMGTDCDLRRQNQKSVISQQANIRTGAITQAFKTGSTMA